jgi:hypothetical protein
MTIVRYTVKPGHASLNEELIRAVFAELSRERPAVSYSVYRDGDTFIHVADGDGLTELPSFRAFVDGHASRCLAPAEVSRVERVGTFSGMNG